MSTTIPAMGNKTSVILMYYCNFQYLLKEHIDQFQIFKFSIMTFFVMGLLNDPSSLQHNKALNDEISK
jgi:hypothetical protein